MKNIDQNNIKKKNRRCIIEILYHKRKVTKQEIVKKTGLSLPTVTNNINHLVKKKIALEVGQANSTGGRKPVIIHFNPHAGYVVGVEAMPETLRCLITNLDMDIIYDKSASYSNPGAGILRDINSAISNSLKKKNITHEKVIGAGICFPGIVNKNKDILEFAPNMDIRNLSLKKISNRFSFPVYFENEANAAALAELNLGVAQCLKNLIYISIGSGVGSGIILNGKLYTGTNFRGGEFGHMVLVPGGRKCNCGNKGCLEQYISEKALEREFRKIAPNEGFPEGLIAALKKKVPDALNIFNEYIGALAIGLHNLTALLDPHYIVIGGRISAHLEYYKKELYDQIYFGPYPGGRKRPELLISSLKEDSACLGAALIPLEKLFSPVKQFKPDSSTSL